MKFVRWRDFNALRRAHMSLHVTRRVVTPKSNTGTGAIARRNGACVNGAFSVFSGFWFPRKRLK